MSASTMRWVLVSTVTTVTAIAAESNGADQYSAAVYDPTTGTYFTSRLDVNVIDLDYTGAPVEFVNVLRDHREQFSLRF